MQRTILGVAAAVLCTGWALSFQPGASQAQTPTPQARPATPQAAPATPQTEPATPQAHPSAEITDQKLDQTAAAVHQVQSVRTSYRQKLSTASPDQQDKIKAEANAALQKAVTDQGLSVDEYDSIIEVAQNDPSVRARLLQRLSAMKK